MEAAGSQVLFREGTGKEARQSTGAWPRPFCASAPPFCLGPQAHHPFARVSKVRMHPHTLHSFKLFLPMCVALALGCFFLKPESVFVPDFVSLTSLSPFGCV